MRVLVRMLSHTAVQGFVGVTPSKTAPETSSTTRKMGPISPASMVMVQSGRSGSWTPPGTQRISPRVVEAPLAGPEPGREGGAVDDAEVEDSDTDGCERKWRGDMTVWVVFGRREGEPAALDAALAGERILGEGSARPRACPRRPSRIESAEGSRGASGGAGRGRLFPITSPGALRSRVWDTRLSPSGQRAPAPAHRTNRRAGADRLSRGRARACAPCSRRCARHAPPRTRCRRSSSRTVADGRTTRVVHCRPGSAAR